ncbi:centromere protein X-like [Onthophagus taurus]|uniref:centromere protein X-like n=1 Tax=Onthophagus taurus TaxID=166361 RepID=UPI000C207AE9|nr:centromere protein X-like [Onthophagus taurus]
MAESSSSSEISIYSQIVSEFKPTIIKEVFKMQANNSKMKLNDEVSDAICRLLKIMVIECALRATKQAKKQNRTKITLDDVEFILVQMMLDFP